MRILQILIILICFHTYMYGEDVYSAKNDKDRLDTIAQSTDLLFNIYGGVSILSNDFTSSYSSNLNQQRKDIKWGANWGCDIYFRCSKRVLLGLNFNYYNSSAEGKYGSNNEYHTPYFKSEFYESYTGDVFFPESVDIEEVNTTLFIGPSVMYQIYKRELSTLYFSTSIGYLQYKYSYIQNEYYNGASSSNYGYPESESHSADIKGNTYGIIPSLSYSYHLNSRLSTFVKIAFVVSYLEKYEQEMPFHENYSVELDKGDYINLCRSEITIGLSFNK